MRLTLMGVTSLETIKLAHAAGVDTFSFDLRPKSFNFIQSKKIKSILNEAPLVDYRLTFANEKDFMVSALYNDIKLTTPNLKIEFTGVTKLHELSRLEEPFVWHYNSDEKLRDIPNNSKLERVVLDHRVLSDYNDRGELFGFLQLFQGLQGVVEFDLLLDWDTEIIGSMFEYFNFSGIVLEVNQKIEQGYQQVNHSLLLNQIQYYQDLFKG